MSCAKLKGAEAKFTNKPAVKNYVYYIPAINRKRQTILLLLCFFAVSARSQTAQQVFSNSGIWGDYGVVVNSQAYNLKGRLVNIPWRDIETSPNVWNWQVFDTDIIQHIDGDKPVIFMVYTGMNAPDWLFTNGVPKVVETDSRGNTTGYSPYYLNADYNFYFKRMITKVREHVQTLPTSVRNKILAVQACFGNTGDQITYKGNVPVKYAISDEQFDSLFKVYSLYYYNEYKNLTPAIKILSNFVCTTSSQAYWLDANCPGGWIKAGTINRGFQLNMEGVRNTWLYDIMNKPWSGQYMLSRSEWVGPQLDAGWWKKNPYKSMFALMCYNTYWGLDFPNQTYEVIKDAKFDSAFRFFNKYAGQKVPGLATNAMCALKDVLDAADESRFPVATYGKIERNNLTRYAKIQQAYAAYGAKLEDKTVLDGAEYLSCMANGINDVGWYLLPGNYDRFLHQIDANATSAGYWNVDSENPNVMYGRFARGFDLANGKNALYFDVEDNFLRNKPLDGAYSVTIEVTYYDNGGGSWQLFYDAKSGSDKASVSVTCGNTKTWKKKAIVLSDAYFGNRSTRKSDFYIKSTKSNNVIFSIVELSRPQQSAKGFITTSLSSFDTVCTNSTAPPKSFVLNATGLDGSIVKIGPKAGYILSKSMNGPYTSILNFSNYGNQINATVYVKLKTSKEGNYNGSILIRGGGASTVAVTTQGYVKNTSPALNAVLTQISCYQAEDGAIDLQPAGGIGPFTYAWTSTLKNGWKSTNQDVNNLKAADYTVTVGSYAGCTTKKTFSIIDPGKVQKPGGIDGPSSVKKQQKGLIYSVMSPLANHKYVWSVPDGATITSGQNTSSITVNWGKGNGKVGAQTQTNCGVSDVVKKAVKIENALATDAGSADAVGISNIYHNTTLTNPARDIATLQFYSESASDYMIMISDLTGKILLIKKGITMQGNNIEKLNIQQFAAGNYFIVLINSKGEKQTLKLLKQ